MTNNKNPETRLTVSGFFALMEFTIQLEIIRSCVGFSVKVKVVTDCDLISSELVFPDIGNDIIFRSIPNSDIISESVLPR